MRPPIPITDPRFVWVPACATNLHATFARERARLAEIAEQQQRSAQVESLLTRRVLNIFEARRAEAQQAATRG